MGVDDATGGVCGDAQVILAEVICVILRALVSERSNVTTPSWDTANSGEPLNERFVQIYVFGVYCTCGLSGQSSCPSPKRFFLYPLHLPRCFATPSMSSPVPSSSFVALKYLLAPSSKRAHVLYRILGMSPLFVVLAYFHPPRRVSAL